MEMSLHSPHEEVFVNELFSSCCLLQFYQRTMWTMWLGKYSICTIQHAVLAYLQYTVRSCQIFEIRAGRVLIWLSNHCSDNTHDTHR